MYTDLTILIVQGIVATMLFAPFFPSWPRIAVFGYQTFCAYLAYLFWLVWLDLPTVWLCIAIWHIVACLGFYSYLLSHDKLFNRI